MKSHTETVIDDVLALASELIRTRTLFVSNIGDTFRILKVFNREGCSISEGLELPKDHSI